jgi:hypothetical protein
VLVASSVIKLRDRISLRVKIFEFMVKISLSLIYEYEKLFDVASLVFEKWHVKKIYCILFTPSTSGRH